MLPISSNKKRVALGWQPARRLVTAAGPLRRRQGPIANRPQVANLMPLVFSHLKYVDNVGPSARFGSKCSGVLPLGDAEVVGNQQIRLQDWGPFAKPLVKWY